MFLIQHGTRKGSTIDEALRLGFAQGVVFGAGDESHDSLVAFSAKVRAEFPEAIVLLDPQVHVLALPDPNTKRLGTYSYGASPLGARDFSARRLSKLVDQVFQVQLEADVTALVGPTVALRGFTDQWTQIALTLAQESVDRANELGTGHPVYVSVLMTEDSLLNWQALNEFLDELTTLRCTGFYLSIARNARSPLFSFESEKLSNLLLAVDSLSRLNGFDVVVGYASLLGFLFRAAGARMTAAGWYDTTRSLSLSRWEAAKVGGGRVPLLKYTSETLLNRLYVETDLPQIASRGLDEAVLGASPLARLVGEKRWNAEWDRLQFLAACSLLDKAMDVPDPVEAADGLLSASEALHRRLRNVILQPGSGGRHVASWRAGLERYRRLAG